MIPWFEAGTNYLVNSSLGGIQARNSSALKEPQVDYVGSTFLPPVGDYELPKEVDLRKLGFVTPIKDQVNRILRIRFSAY